MSNTKYLALIRHAKTNEHHPKGDYYRTLSETGIIQTHRIAEQLYNFFEVQNIDLTSIHVEASSAVRTFETGITIADSLDVELVSNDLLYNSTSAHILNVAKNLLQYNQVVLLVAHNPGISEAASILAERETALAPSEACIFSLSESNSDELGKAKLLNVCKREG